MTLTSTSLLVPSPIGHTQYITVWFLVPVSGHSTPVTNTVGVEMPKLLPIIVRIAPPMVGAVCTCVYYQAPMQSTAQHQRRTDRIEHTGKMELTTGLE